MDSPQNGYHKESDTQLKLTMTNALQAPNTIIEIVSNAKETVLPDAQYKILILCHCGSACQKDDTDDDDNGDMQRLLDCLEDYANFCHE